MSSLCFFQLSIKLAIDNYSIESLQADSLFKFHKICKFENHVTRNDVIMMSLPKTMEKQWENADLHKTKQNIYRSKGFDESYPKMLTFIEFEPLCQKLWAFMSSDHSPNMVMSHDPGYKFRKFYFSPNSILNFRKTYQIWGKLAEEQKVTHKKQNSEWKTPPVLTGLRLVIVQLSVYN